MKPGFGNIQNIFNGTGSRYWTPQKLTKWLYGGKPSEVVGGQMPNKVVGSSDYLTVAGSSGSETFQTPNTSPYSSADADTLWCDGFGAFRTVTTVELKGYDFTKTFVKFGDTTPNAIEEVWILKAGETLTADELLNCYTYFHLPVYWSGSWVDEGYLKDNRTLSQRYVYAGNAADSDAVALINRMIAAGETPVIARKQLINSRFIALKSAGLYTKIDALWTPAAHGVASAVMNWIENDHNMAPYNLLPAFTVDKGFNGVRGDDYMMLDFVPVTDGVNFQRNSASIAFHSLSNVDNAGYDMAISEGGNIGLASRTSNSTIFRINGAENSIANTDGKGFYLANRSSSVTCVGYKNKVKSNLNNQTSEVLSTGHLYITVQGEIKPFVWIGGSLTEQEENDLFDIMVDGYLDVIGAKT